MDEKKELFKEFDNHLMKDKKPSTYFNEKYETGLFKNIYPFTLLGKLAETEQSAKYHPEGSVWNHTMLVVDKAAEVKTKSEEPKEFMWAALLHDIGKAPTTKIRRGRITSYDHDKVGEKLSIQFLRELTQDEVFIYKVSKLVRWHMQTLFVVKQLPFADISTMCKETNFNEVALLSLCDRVGRGKMSEGKFEEEKMVIEGFLKKCEENVTK
ncbi:HDIG domain-containing metalloprotein [Haloimpatiens sp. FM7330]|uniref:HDIG domain-containing metalloprotein n=1 Tax=Haloimpatiens sp. FM7330 TaxID=3298610 RepID=UPI00362E66BC